jgi:hypothetical protein
MHNGEREAGGHSSINGVSTLPHDLHARLGSQHMNADHHRMLASNRVG